MPDYQLLTLSIENPAESDRHNRSALKLNASRVPQCANMTSDVAAGEDQIMQFLEKYLIRRLTEECLANDDGDR
jgi:hypothetical protein